MNDRPSNAPAKPRRTRTVMLRFTDREYEVVMAAWTPEVRISVFLRNLALDRLASGNRPRVEDALACLVTTYVPGVRFDEARQSVEIHVMKRETDDDRWEPDDETGLPRDRNVMLRFTDDEFDMIMAADGSDTATAVFLRNLVLDALAEGPLPGLRESVAFVMSSLLPDASFQEVLELFDHFMQSGSKSHEVHEEPERRVFLARTPGLA